MTPDDVKAVRRATGMSQKDLAAALEVEVGLVRDWEKGERFPTKALCETMARLRDNPPPRPRGKTPTPMQLLADPGFFTLVRKLLAHRSLRLEVDKLAAGYPDPLDDDSGAG